jgi:hypothetical protein
LGYLEVAVTKKRWGLYEDEVGDLADDNEKEDSIWDEQ